MGKLSALVFFSQKTSFVKSVARAYICPDKNDRWTAQAFSNFRSKALKTQEAKTNCTVSRPKLLAKEQSQFSKGNNLSKHSNSSGIFFLDSAKERVVICCVGGGGENGNRFTRNSLTSGRQKKGLGHTD